MKKEDIDQIYDGAVELLAVAVGALYGEMIDKMGLPKNIDTLRGAVAMTVTENMGDHECAHEPPCTRGVYERITALVAKKYDMEVPITL